MITQNCSIKSIPTYEHEYDNHDNKGSKSVYFFVYALFLYIYISSSVHEGVNKVLLTWRPLNERHCVHFVTKSSCLQAIYLR